MGLFAFIKEAGEKLFGTGEANAAARGQREQRHQQTDPRAVDQPAQDVAAEVERGGSGRSAWWTRCAGSPRSTGWK